MGSPLPEWVARGVAHRDVLGLRVHPSSGNGDCLFDSVRQILASIGLPCSVGSLREAVARPVLEEKDEVVNRTIDNWMQLYRGALQERDLQLEDEYRHMRPVHEAPLPLSPEHRQQLYDVMLTEHYWGEQHACRILEESHQMRFIIFCEDIQAPQLTWYHSNQFKPIRYCFLYLRHQHYMPVSWNQRFVFRWDEIPYALQAFVTKAYTKDSSRTRTRHHSAARPNPASAVEA